MSNVDKLHLPAGLKLYNWQEDFINNHNRDRVLLCAEAGTGKSIAIMCWFQLRPDGINLLICPKGIVDKWKIDLEKWHIKCHVTTHDQLKKLDLNEFTAIAVDECHAFSASLFDKTRSERATFLYTALRLRPQMNVILVSATPIRSKPENLHTLACYLGIYWPINKFREEYLQLTDKFGRYHWEPKKDWRIKIRKKLEEIAYIVNMRDQVDVPVHEEQIIHVKWNKGDEKKLKNQYLEPAKEWHTRHRLEQSNTKWLEVKKIIDGNSKVVVVCYYLEQIEDYRKKISGERELYILTGSTKDQGQVIKDANKSSDCVLLIQASLGAGFDLDSFSVMVFASMSFSFVSLVQMKARINRIHNLHRNQYVYLLGGKCDRAVYEQLEKGKDFYPPSYMI